MPMSKSHKSCPVVLSQFFLVGDWLMDECWHFNEAISTAISIRWCEGYIFCPCLITSEWHSWNFIYFSPPSLKRHIFSHLGYACHKKSNLLLYVAWGQHFPWEVNKKGLSPSPLCWVQGSCQNFSNGSGGGFFLSSKCWTYLIYFASVCPAF